MNAFVSGPESPSLPPTLVAALRQARAWGFLGDGPLDVHLAHAHGFADASESVDAGGIDPLSPPAVGESQAGTWLDLGSGGGIPGLVLANRWPHREAVLLDSSERRARFLAQTVENLGWADRVRVVTARAELAGRDPALRGAFSLVVARSFGPPPVTAECGAPFLRREGLLIVSEPPILPSAYGDDDARWPVDGLAALGLERHSLWRGKFGYRVLRQSRECPERFPRRVGVPAKRPLYRTAEVSSSD
jgi:16S rRNA (guanine527-N7)-methyltransferase